MLGTKKVLVGVAAFGVLAAGTAGGTFASFNAETTNAGNTFATGTLTMTNSTTSQSACFSGDGAGNTESCSSILTGAKVAPGGARQTGTVTIKNGGSLDASKLYVYAPTAADCVDAKTQDDGDALAFNSTTGNPLCGATLMSIEETTGGKHYCWYGVAATAPGSPGRCEAGIPALNASTATSTIAAFAAAHNATAGKIDLTQVSADGVSGGTDSPLATEDSVGRTFEVGLYLRNSTSNQNSLQGLQSTFGLTWHIDQ
jgi:predicted ribosomally synthesized peptide with SipW-like signal peptide